MQGRGHTSPGRAARRSQDASAGSGVAAGRKGCTALRMKQRQVQPRMSAAHMNLWCSTLCSGRRPQRTAAALSGSAYLAPRARPHGAAEQQQRGQRCQRAVPAQQALVRHSGRLICITGHQEEQASQQGQPAGARWQRRQRRQAGSSLRLPHACLLHAGWTQGQNHACVRGGSRGAHTAVRWRRRPEVCRPVHRCSCAGRPSWRLPLRSLGTLGARGCCPAWWPTSPWACGAAAAGEPGAACLACLPGATPSTGWARHHHQHTPALALMMSSRGECGMAKQLKGKTAPAENRTRVWPALSM